MGKPILNKQMLQDIIELQEMGLPMPIGAGVCEAEDGLGGYNACLSDGIDHVIVFGKPVFKDKKKALRYAYKKLEGLLEQMAEDAKKLGYAIEIDSQTGKAQ